MHVETRNQCGKVCLSVSNLATIEHGCDSYITLDSLQVAVDFIVYSYLLMYSFGTLFMVL